MGFDRGFSESGDCFGKTNTTLPAQVKRLAADGKSRFYGVDKKKRKGER